MKLTLDGVFFMDGGFAGPNQLGSWEQLTETRAAFLNVADAARKTPATSAGRAEFFSRMQQQSGLTGNEPQTASGMVIPPRRAFRPPLAGGTDIAAIKVYQQQFAARQALSLRNAQGEAAAIARIAAWLDDPGPELHRL